MNLEDRKNEIKSTLARMKEDRAIDHQRRVEACQYMQHRIGKHVGRIDIYDTTAIDAMNTTCNGMAGYLMSPSIRWFRFMIRGRRFELADRMYGVLDWLEIVTNIIYTKLSNSSFYSTTNMAFKDAFVYGTSYEFIYEDMEENSIVYDCLDPFECYIAEDAKHKVYKFYREYELTAEQAVINWGDKVPQKIKDAIKEKQGNKKFTFVNAIYRRENAVKGLSAACHKKWGSWHFCVEEDEVFDESGYDDFPIAIHRFKRVAGSPYGESICMEYIPEIKKLNELSKMMGIGIQMQAFPPLMIPEALKGKFDYRPSAKNFVDMTNGNPTPVNVNLNINYLREYLSELQVRLQRLLYADLFNVLMRQERQRTAYEVQELKGEGLVLLSAIIGNIQVEKIEPLVDRTFKLMQERDLFPPFPQDKAKVGGLSEITIELDGPLAQTMKMYHQTQGLTQGLQSIAAVAQIFPNSLINFDADEISRQYATAMGLPQTCIKEFAEVQKIKDEQAKVQQQQQQQQQMMAESQAAKNYGLDLNQLSQSIAQSNGGLGL